MATDYQVGFYFSLSFQGEDSAFQEVSGLSKEYNLEEVVSGGENRFKYRLPTTTTYQNLVLKRAIVAKGSALAKWVSDTLDDGLANPIKTQDVTVQLYNAEGTVAASWTFSKAYPVKWSISDLKSQENELVIESMELAYQYFKSLS